MRKDEEKDKKRTTIEDLLKAYTDGLSIQDIITKTGLARHTVLARLHRLEGEEKVRLRKVNMAKLYYWIEDPQQLNLKQQEQQPLEQDEKIKEGIQLTKLKEEHISTIPKKKKNTVIDITRKKQLKAKEAHNSTNTDNGEPIPEATENSSGENKEPFTSSLPQQSIDAMKKLKENIESQIKRGGLPKREGEILKQRVPVTYSLQGVKQKEKSVKEGDYLKTGIMGFDSLFDRGIPKGNSIIVAGGAGSGKTIFCLQALHYHASQGRKCLYMSFEESEERLIKHMEDFGWNPRELIKKGLLVVKRFNPFDITRNVDALLMKAKGELLIDVEPVILPDHFFPEFITVDSLTAIASAFTTKDDSYRIYIEQLFRFFEKINTTTFLITETEQIPRIFSSSGMEEFLADGVIVFYAIKRGNVRENAIEVLKMRGERHEKKIVAMRITDEGIVVYPEQEVLEYSGESDSFS